MSGTVENATEIRPFHIDIPEDKLTALRRRIAAQLRLAPAPVVVRGPVVREFLDRRQRHALRLIRDGLLLGPLRSSSS